MHKKQKVRSTQEKMNVSFACRAASNGFVLAVVTLTDEKQLNALSLDMIRAITKQLSLWQQDDRVACVLLQSSGDKAFCAGGDVLQLHRMIQQGPEAAASYAHAFFSEEYALDYLMHTYGKPIICIGSGIVMGGGVGLMAGASHRIVTETSLLAMPEITIGLFPDVGASWFLNKMPGYCGIFLGLTGARVRAEDILFVGLGDYFVTTDRIAEISEGLLELPWQGTNNQFNRLVTEYLSGESQNDTIVAENAMLWRYFHALTYAFMDCSDAMMMRTALESLALKESWFEKPLITLNKGCPLSVMVFIEQMSRAKHLSLEQVFKMELAMVMTAVKLPDLAEGIRALLIDKTGAPHWSHCSLNAVMEGEIENFFDGWQK